MKFSNIQFRKIVPIIPIALVDRIGAREEDGMRLPLPRYVQD